MKTKEHDRIFRQAYLFKNLDEEGLDLFRKIARFERYTPNELIISEGETGDSLYLVLDGSVRITKATLEGYEQVIGLLGEGEFFGEMALMDRKTRSASVYAHKPVELAIFPHQQILSIFESRPGMGYKVVRTFAEVLSLRLRNTNEKLKSLLVLERTL